MTRLNLPASLDEAWLWSLDRIRLDRPKDVSRLLERAVPLVKEDLRPLLYLVCGAAYRQLERLPDAEWAYNMAEDCAEGDRRMTALIVQRRAWIYAANGQLSKALDHLRTAAGIFTELGDLNAVGKTLIDRGTLFYHLENLENSNSCFEEGLIHLDEGEFDNRFAAYNLCALNARLQGRNPSAIAWLRKAKEVLPFCARQAGDKLRWLTAEWLVDAGKFIEAADEYDEIIERSKQKGNMVDAALAIAEKAKALLEGGQPSLAESVATELNTFIFQVSSQTAQAALIEARKLGLQGQWVAGLRLAARVLSKLRVANH